MKTYHLGTEQVRAYLRDFVERLRGFQPRPTIWCPITQSGDDLLSAICELISEECPEMIEGVRLLPIEVDGDAGKSIRFLGEDPKDVIPGQSVLLLDGAAHSGKMMSRCADEVLLRGPSELSSYVLVLKRGSSFIPTLWGMMIDETDRAYFLLNKIPNNRLHAEASYPQPLVQLRKLNENHVARPALVSGVKSIDRMTWSDRRFQMKTSNTCTYVLEKAQAIVGFLTIHFSGLDELVIDEIVIDPEHQRKGYGGVLLRFADTLARQADCRVVKLNAIERGTEFYKGFKYRLVPDREPISLDDEVYRPMERAVLYHQSPLR